MHLARCQWPQVHCNREFKLQKIGHSAQRCRLSGVSKQRTHIKDQRSTRRIVACSASVTAERQVAEEGDNVQLHFTVFNEGNERLESTKDAGQPLAFEVGSSAIIDNELLSAFDAGIRGLGMGETRRLEMQSLQDEWKPELLFRVPADHQEVTRLQGKYSKTGGLQKGMIIQLANGNQAQVMDVGSEVVILDANHAMAGQKLTFEIELASLEKSTS